jgi:hypothetical protein
LPELFALVSASRPSDKVVVNIRRLTKGPTDEPLTRSEELKHLRLVARIGASARDTAIGNAVINRCIVLAQKPGRLEGITDVLEVMVEACAAYSKPDDYRKQVGEAVTAICYAANERIDLQNVLAISDTLCIRDEKLTFALAKARAVALVKIGRLSSADPLGAESCDPELPIKSDKTLP